MGRRTTSRYMQEEKERHERETRDHAAEPVVAELVVAEPIVAELVVVDPSVAEPVVAEPVAAELVVAELIVANPVVAEPTLPVAEPTPPVAEPSSSMAEPTLPIVRSTYPSSDPTHGACVEKKRRPASRVPASSAPAPWEDKSNKKRKAPVVDKGKGIADERTEKRQRHRSGDSRLPKDSSSRPTFEFDMLKAIYRDVPRSADLFSMVKDPNVNLPSPSIWWSLKLPLTWPSLV